jgi:hypothetical protein
VLRDDPELRLHLGLVARRYVAAAHAPELVAARAAALFDAVASGGGVAQAEALARGAHPGSPEPGAEADAPDPQADQPAP